MNTTRAWDQVTVVIVTYNSVGILPNCIEHITQAKKIVVVDNASADGTAELARTLSTSIEVIANPRNVGYGTANNQGLKRVETPFVLLLNPDAMVSPGCLEHLVETAEAFPDAAAISPILRNRDGVMEVITREWKKLAYHDVTDEPDGPYCSGCVTAAIMLWRTDKLRAIGGFDEKFFLYGEDDDLFLRTEEAGFAMIVDPGAVALHLGGKSSKMTQRIRNIRDWHIHWAQLENDHRWGGDKDAVRKQGWSMVFSYGRKALLYLVLIRPKRMMGNYVKAHAAWTWLHGGSAWRGPGAR